MPNVWTHILFGKRVLGKSGLPLSGDPKPFQLGCQGPDPLLYYHFWPWKKGKNVNLLGNLIHKKRCGPFLIDLIDKAYHHPDIQEYVMGFVTHHILDRHTHPYINYKSGTGKYKHQKLEVLIDTIVTDKLEQIRTWEVPVADLLDIGSKLPGIWVSILQETAHRHFPEVTHSLPHGYWQQSYRDMLAALRFFHDPLGLKLILTLGYIAPFRYRRISSRKDYLNVSRSEWVHPAIPEERHQESFWDIWETALAEGTHIIRLVHAYWHNEESIQPLSRKIGNISYDTGKDCESGLQNRIASPIV